MAQPSSMIPVAILTGYLGSGKTTLLNRILSSDPDMKIAVLVNDFGALNIDAKLVVGVEGETITLSNGCICCTIRGDLVDAIAQLVRSDAPPDYIIVEASGVSDPAQIILTFNRSFLRTYVQIDSIIAVVDAGQFGKHDQKPERLLREQVRVSDIVILNKVDLVSDDTLQQVRSWIENAIDKARIIETTYCDVPIEVLIGNATYNPQTAFDTSGPGVHAHDVKHLNDHQHNDHSLVFATWSWESTQPASLSKIRAVLDDLPREIFRAKGIIFAEEMPDTQIIMQLVGKRVSLTEGAPWGDQIPMTSITLIGDIGSVDQLLLEATFAETQAGEDRSNDIGQFVDGVLKWLRAW